MFKRTINLLISIIVYYIDRFEILFGKIVGSKIHPKYIVLYYHAVRKEQRECFARQLDEIIRLATPFSLDSTYPCCDGLYHVAVTFDDGLISFFHNALPELLKRNIPFTVFVPTGYIGKHPGWMNTTSHQSESEIVINHNQLRDIKKFNIAQIGSHCISHRHLKTLPDDEARDEMLRSKSDLEKILEQNITTLSFPHGSFNKTHIEYAKEAGYERVFSIMPSLAFANGNEYVTGRIKVDPDDWMLEFRLKICGAYRWLPLAYAAKKALRNI